MDEPVSLVARLARLEAIAEIRQLAYCYALAVDARDLEALVSLYVEDIRVGKELTGRAALKEMFDRALRQFTVSAHLVTNHVIEFLGEDDALGLVNCRIEHEVGDQWVSAILLYHDRYARREGRWLFRGRVQARLYATGQDDPPVGEKKIRWPGRPHAESGYHDALPAFAEFWEMQAKVVGEIPGPDIADHMVTRLRRSVALPPPPRYIF